MTLSLENLRVEVEGRTVVRGVSLTIETGRITTLLGPNGSGKSELVLAVAGVLEKAAGRVLLDGRDISALDPARIRAEGVAAVPEGHQVLAGLSVDDNLRAAASTLKGGPESSLDRIYAVFPELAQRKDQLAGSLSGGEQQMVALGHGLAMSPRFLLIDEMSLGLAPVVVRRLGNVVRELADTGTGILLIEQFAEMALGLSDESLVIRQGEICYSGAPKPLIEDPGKLRNLYLGSSPESR